jgi:hypothetical protein
MLSKFNVYDFIGDIIPGLTCIWAMEWFFKTAGVGSPLPAAGQLTETSTLIVLGYLCGLMLQALSETITEKRVLLRLWKGFPSERMLLPNDSSFSAERKQDILKLVRERFHVGTDPIIPEGASPESEEAIRRRKNQELFSLCYNYVDNLSPKVLLFNAQYGMFRCLVTLFALLLVGSIPVTWSAWSGPFGKNWQRLLVPAVFLAFGWLSYLRCCKRSKDFARAVYDLFISGVAAPPSKGEH